MRTTTKLRELLSEDRLLVSPFTFDAFTAKIAETVGFPIVYMSGFGTAMSKGYPDVGLVSMSEMVENAHRIASTVSVPVIADADTGYGNAINVRRTIREYEQAGVAGVHMEDQVFPKKCGFFEGKEVIPMEEHVAKVRAALDAREDPDFLVIARCDALAVNGWDDTIRRCRAYYEAGADMVFVDGPVDDLDHASSSPKFGGKVGIDATAKGVMDGRTREWPSDIVMSDEIKALVDVKWSEYGI